MSQGDGRRDKRYKEERAATSTCIDCSDRSDTSDTTTAEAAAPPARPHLSEQATTDKERSKSELQPIVLNYSHQARLASSHTSSNLRHLSRPYRRRSLATHPTVANQVVDSPRAQSQIDDHTAALVPLCDLQRSWRSSRIGRRIERAVQDKCELESATRCCACAACAGGGEEIGSVASKH